MLQISSFLKKFQRFGRPDIATREASSSVIKEYIGFEITPKDISIKNGIVYLKNPPPVVKSEIFIKRDRIIDKIINISKDKTIKDIRFK